MKRTFIKFYMLVCALIFISAMANAQATVSGSVKDALSSEPLAGVNIVIKGTVSGTISDSEGNFSVKIRTTPATLIFSMIGFSSQELEVTGDMANVEIKMEESTILGEEIVISASRVEESILESPVTIEKMDILNIQQAAAADFYDGLSNLKGVHTNQGSLTLTSINTRGFAAIANTRFVQLMDGMDNAAPLLNFPTGNIVGISELDMESMELVPGAASALYGPNAFNGILFMNSKSPFDYQGLSAQVKTGVTTSDASGSNFYSSYSFRYARSIKDRFAFKLNASYLSAQDWWANDYTTGRATTATPAEEFGHQNFDGLNTYGDETPIDLSAFGVGVIRRTGWNEQDLLINNNARSLKLSGALHYRINDNLEAMYNYRYGSGSSIYQGGERYVLRGFYQQYHKLELKSSNFYVRAYMSQTDDGDSYNLSAMGAVMNEILFPTVVRDNNGNIIGGWGPVYAQAYAGAFAGLGVPAGSHAAARAFADGAGATASGYTARPQVGDATFVSVSDRVRNGFFQRGGAGFIDDSKLYHAEFNYNFEDLIDPEIIKVQVGGNWRRYDLFSDGTVFNEDPENSGSNDRIKIDEYGFYLQLGKRILDDRLNLTTSLRFDKNENFNGQFNPRFSAVYSAGSERQHNFRASFQTGFRNPSTQGQFIYFPLGTAILLGGTQQNAERYGVFKGGAWTVPSVLAFQGSGDPNDLEEANIDYVQPEQLSAIEIGYKGAFADKKLLIDINVYHNIYNDFIVQQNVFSKNETTHQGQTIPAFTVFRLYSNAEQELNSTGVGLGLAYQLPKGYRIDANYSYATFDDNGAPADFESGFNTPQNRVKLGFSNREVVKNLGFNLNYRWQQSFEWQNSFGIGTVDSYGVLDAAFSYKISNLKTMLKLGGTNLLNNEYRTNVGGPYIGSMYYISLTFDEFMRK